MDFFSPLRVRGKMSGCRFQTFQPSTLESMDRIIFIVDIMKMMMLFNHFPEHKPIFSASPANHNECQ